MFNASYINRARPNHMIGTDPDFRVSAELIGSLTGWANAGADHVVSQLVNGHLTGSGQAAQGLLIVHSSKNSLSGTATAIAKIFIQGDLKGLLKGNAKVAADVHVADAELKAELDGNANIGANIYTNLEISGELTGQAAIGSDTYVESVVFGTLTGYANAYDVEEYVFRFEGVLEPGGTLIIDSEFHNLLLNNQNAIHLKSGDWIKLDRSTLSLTVESAGGIPEMEVFCNTLYL